MKTVAEIAGKKLTLTNLDKNIYPSFGLTKAQILDYYRRISPFMLPHLQDRALTLKRYPNGVEEEYFFEKRCPAHRPAWVSTAEIAQRREEPITACLVNDLSTLMWVENLASIELHIPQARSGSQEIPDYMVFDLDPGDGADILVCAKVAMILKDMLDEMKLVSCVKTSGQKGLHIFVPLNNQDTTFDDIKKFTKAMAEILQNNYPEMVTSKMAKEYRKEKVFINWSQNNAAKTMVCVYSLRARKNPTVSCPLSWKELEEKSARNQPEEFQFLYIDALERAEKMGDLFQDVLTKKQRLP
ncbi:MAG: non-homologous end-joining DNA ligase [Smithella sp.]